MSNPNSLIAEVAYRDCTESDLPFVMSAWLNSFKRSLWAGNVANNMYTSVHKNTIQQLVHRGMKITVAYNREDPDQLLGFVAHELAESGVPVVHYLFVKDSFRSSADERVGIGSSLMECAGAFRRDFVYTFKTSDSRYFPQGKYVPSIARRKDLNPVWPKQS